MSKSIKKRLGAAHFGLDDKELRKLFNAVLADMAAMRTTLAASVTDIASLKTAANALVADAVKINNNTASANNTVTLTAAGVTLTSTAPAALTLLS